MSFQLPKNTSYSSSLFNYLSFNIKKKGEIRIFLIQVYFLRSSKMTAIAIAAIMAIVEPEMYVSVGGGGAGVAAGGVGSGASSTVI